MRLPFSILAAAAFALCAHAAETAKAQPTFHKDVEPILQKRCQSCHRPGEAAPFALLTFEQSRPWAKAIRAAVVARKMPPWHAEKGVGHFANDRSLTDAEIATLSAWAESGAPRGDAKDAPAPKNWPQGWTIGKPDLVLEAQAEYDVPAQGVIDYQWIRIPTGFTEDKWIQAIECRPGDEARPVVHHIIAVTRRSGSPWMKDVPPGQYVAKPPRSNETGMSDGMLGDYVPGMPGLVFPKGMAMRLPAGSDVFLQLHYTPNGKAVKDRSKVGFVFAPEPPAEEVFDLIIANGRFKIPPGDPNYQVNAAVALGSSVKVLSLNPHMHLRGKSFEVTATTPGSGDKRALLRVPRYDFAWQTSYEPEGLSLPEGTRLDVAGWFDNSPNNKWNPDPKAEVTFGDQTTDEMMVLFLHVAAPRTDNPKPLLRRAAAAEPDSYDRPRRLVD